MDAIAKFHNTPESLRLKEGEILKGAILQSGFIAQEVEKAAQDLGYDFSGVDKPQNDKDIYSLRYAEFVVPLVKAMQEQQQTIENHQEIIHKLELRITQLERLEIERQAILKKQATELLDLGAEMEDKLLLQEASLPMHDFNARVGEKHRETDTYKTLHKQRYKLNTEQ